MPKPPVNPGRFISPHYVYGAVMPALLLVGAHLAHGPPKELPSHLLVTIAAAVNLPLTARALEPYRPRPASAPERRRQQDANVGSASGRPDSASLGAAEGEDGRGALRPARWLSDHQGTKTPPRHSWADQCGCASSKG